MTLLKDAYAEACPTAINDSGPTSTGSAAASICSAPNGGSCFIGAESPVRSTT